MSWADSLQEASFRGVKFDVISIRDSSSKDTAQYEYPYIDGADIDDLGRKARNVRLSAVFWGDDYDIRLQRFISVLDKRGSGELIHPVFGSMPNMQLIENNISHDAENIDYCTVELVFLESKVGQPFFGSEYPTSKADAIFNQVQSAMDKGQSLIDSALAPLRDTKKMMARTKALASTALNMVTVFRSEITGFVSSTTDFINYPSAFISDLRSALSLTSSNSSIRASSGAMNISNNAVMVDWKESRKQLVAVATLPEALVTGEAKAPLPMPSNATPADIAELTTLVSLSVATQLALNAAAILGDESLMTVLSPKDIELITNDTRQALQDAIRQHRELYGPAIQQVQTSVGILWQPVVDDLKSTALSVQQLAEAVITLRPPLVQREVTSDCNLRLLAHRWYGDHSRAIELQRLNPQLRNPNNLRAGDVLYAYAE